MPDSYLEPTIRVRRGQKIRIHFHNDLPQESIIHWHGLQFKVLGRLGAPFGDVLDLGWKDTVLLMPGERVRLQMRFPTPGPHPSRSAGKSSLCGSLSGPTSTFSA